MSAEKQLPHQLDIQFIVLYHEASIYTTHDLQNRVYRLDVHNHLNSIESRVEPMLILPLRTGLTMHLNLSLAVVVELNLIALRNGEKILHFKSTRECAL